MPEDESIAAILEGCSRATTSSGRPGARRALIGRRLVAFEEAGCLTSASVAPGTLVTAVEPMGQPLPGPLDDGRTQPTHLRRVAGVLRRPGGGAGGRRTELPATARLGPDERLAPPAPGAREVVGTGIAESPSPKTAWRPRRDGQPLGVSRFLVIAPEAILPDRTRLSRGLVALHPSLAPAAGGTTRLGRRSELVRAGSSARA